MAAGHGQSFRAHSFRGTNLLFGRDGAIVSRDDKPAGFGVPRRLLDRRAQDGALGRALNCEYPALLRRRKILSKTLPNAFFCQHQVAVLNLSKLTVGWRGREFRRHAAEGFAFLGSEGRNVNQSRHF